MESLSFGGCFITLIVARLELTVNIDRRKSGEQRGPLRGSKSHHDYTYAHPGKAFIYGRRFQIYEAKSFGRDLRLAHRYPIDGQLPPCFADMRRTTSSNFAQHQEQRRVAP